MPPVILTRGQWCGMSSVEAVQRSVSIVCEELLHLAMFPVFAG